MNYSGILGASQVISFLMLQGGQNLAPSTSLLHPRDSHASEATCKQDPHGLYYVLYKRVYNKLGKFHQLALIQILRNNII